MSGVTVERDRTSPTALCEKECSHLNVCRIFHLEEIDSWHAFQFRFWWKFLSDGILQTREVSERIKIDVLRMIVLNRYIYIYLCIYIFYFACQVFCSIAIRWQVKGGNFQPNRFPRETNKGAAHFEEMMIPLFVTLRKNFMLIKLGWVVFCDLFFHLTLRKRTNMETQAF